MTKHPVCNASDLPPGEVEIVTVGAVEIGVYNVDGEYYALHNRCPHRGAPLCEGRITGLLTGPEPGEYEFTREGEIVRCPWHGYEFDITTGEFVLTPGKLRTMTYDVEVEPADDAAVEELLAAEFGDPDPDVDTFPVSVEDDIVVVEL